MLYFSTETVFLKTKDFSFTNKDFDLYLNEELELLKTEPKPSIDELPSYYESEDYISHTDSKRSLFEKMYHLVKNYSINKKVNLINHYSLHKGSLLDIGAGTGDFLVRAAKDNWSIQGMEPNDKARNIATNKGVVFTDNLNSLSPHSFDVITMWHVLEHVSDLENQIKLLKKLVKPNGIIIIAVPNFKSFDAKYYGKYWAAYDVPRHLWHFSKTAIEKLFQKENVSLIKIKPMLFDSFYVSLLSEKHKTGKMNYFNAIYVGLKSNLLGLKSKEYSSHIYILKSNS